MKSQLSFHVPTRPMLVAARLRVLFERRGMTLLPKDVAPPLTGFQLALVPAGPTATWLYTDVFDALPDELGRELSQELRVVVHAVGTAEDVIAVERAEAGRVTATVSVRGTTVLAGEGTDLAREVEGGRTLAEVLAAQGLGAFGRHFDDIRGLPGVLVLGFAPKATSGSAADDVIEIDASLSCPTCGEAMRKVTGPRGVFFGCVRFPLCRGKLTEKQAAAQRS
ncbi:MAG: topoisomerase DNA-binding C4 zinc finger domain-containing protein [Myxococcales bacterium]|nr:topoisomerase DNA-binding C4 zinc finger domain-containing protein [Myxococcales bacterium]